MASLANRIKTLQDDIKNLDNIAVLKKRTTEYNRINTELENCTKDIESYARIINDANNANDTTEENNKYTIRNITEDEFVNGINSMKDVIDTFSQIDDIETMIELYTTYQTTIEELRNYITNTVNNDDDKMIVENIN